MWRIMMYRAIIALCMLLFVVLPLLGVLLVTDARVAMGLAFLGTACASMAYGPAYAMIQTIAPANLRGFASAFSLLRRKNRVFAWPISMTPRKAL